MDLVQGRQRGELEAGSCAKCKKRTGNRILSRVSEEDRMQDLEHGL